MNVRKEIGIMALCKLSLEMLLSFLFTVHKKQDEGALERRNVNDFSPGITKAALHTEMCIMN